MVETAASGCILCYEHECQNGASCAQPEELYECKVRKSRQMLALQKYQILKTLLAGNSNLFLSSVNLDMKEKHVLWILMNANSINVNMAVVLTVLQTTRNYNFHRFILLKSLSKKLAFWSIYLKNWVFLAKVFEL